MPRTRGAADTVVGEVEALGWRHAGYRAAAAHYDVVGECLLWTVGQGLGGEFTSEVREAWAAAHGILARPTGSSPPR